MAVIVREIRWRIVLVQESSGDIAKLDLDEEFLGPKVKCEKIGVISI